VELEMGLEPTYEGLKQPTSHSPFSIPPFVWSLPMRD